MQLFNQIITDQKALEELAAFSLPENYGFGTVLCPIMIGSEYKNNQWGPLTLKKYAPLSLWPACKVLHYGQEIFEGMKAYKTPNDEVNLFRPIENAKRFNVSAKRMAMPEIDPELFLTATKAMASYCSHLVPKTSGHSLYIRPFMFATENSLGIKPSESFTFLTIASPSGSYLGDSVKVFIERKASRAAPGGTGTAKAGGNYAASLLTAQKSKDLGYAQTLWLDAIEKKYIEELSGMNFFALIDNELHTPELTDTILEGITRKSIIELAKTMNLKTHERPIPIDELIELMNRGKCQEAFACGTAAIITPIRLFGEEDGTIYQLPEQTPWADKLRKKLLDIQEGRENGPEGWIEKVPRTDLNNLKTG